MYRVMSSLHTAVMTVDMTVVMTASIVANQSGVGGQRWSICLLLLFLIIAPWTKAASFSLHGNNDFDWSLNEEYDIDSSYSSDDDFPTSLMLSDSPACPERNYDVSRKCAKPCETTGDCRGRRKRCLCDGECGLSCINPNLRCPKLDLPSNIRAQSDHRNFGAVARLSCDDGFTLKGAPAKFCSGTGKWLLSNEDGSPTSEEDPECDEISRPETRESGSESGCGHPGAVPNARMIGSDRNFEHPAMVEFVCKEGFLKMAPPGVSSSPKSLSKLGKMRCRKDGRWAGIKPVCADLSGGKDGGGGGGGGEGGEAERGGARGGGGGGRPGKKRKKCKKMSRLRNGEVIGAGQNSIGSSISFKCDFSYRLIGPEEMACGKDGKWSSDGHSNIGDEMPKCVKTDCGNPGNLINGWVEGDKTTLGSVVIFQCIEGAVFEGVADRAKCLETGEWSNPMPKCYQSCVVPKVKDGSTLEYLAGSRIPHGESLSIQCTEGHFISDGGGEASPSFSSNAKCFNGTIDGLPSCGPAPCAGRPPWIRKGKAIFDAMNHGSKARYECDSGYMLQVGDPKFDASPPSFLEVVCRNGQWEGHKPACVPKLCPFPGSLENGQIFLVGNLGEYDYQSYIPNVGESRKIRFGCDKGFSLVGTYGAICVDGAWSPEERPTCRAEMHPILHQDLRGKRSVENVDVEEVDESVGGRRNFSSCQLPLEEVIDVTTRLRIWQPWRMFEMVEEMEEEEEEEEAEVNAVEDEERPEYGREEEVTNSSSNSDLAVTVSLPHDTRVTIDCAYSSSSSSSFIPHDVDEVLDDITKFSRCIDGVWTPSPPKC